MAEESSIPYNHKRIVASVQTSLAIGDDGDVYIWGKPNIFQNQLKSIPVPLKLCDMFLLYKTIHISAGLNHYAAVMECQLDSLVEEREMKGSILAIIQEQAKKLIETSSIDEPLKHFNKKQFITIQQFRQFYLQDKHLKAIQYSGEQRAMMYVEQIPNHFETALLQLQKKKQQTDESKHERHHSSIQNQLIDLFYYYQQLTLETRTKYKSVMWGSTSNGRLGVNGIQFWQSKILQDPNSVSAETKSKALQSKTYNTQNMPEVPPNEVSYICELTTQLFIKIVCGHHHTMAITTAGKLYVWGMGSQGCLGTGRIDDIVIPTELNLNDVIIDITSGAFHCIVLTEKNKMFGWGVNNRGQVGIGNKENQLLPQSITFFEKKKIKVNKLFAGDQHSAAISEQKELFTWGNGDYYRLGHGMLMDEMEPKKLEVLQDVYILDAALGTIHTLCITNEGFVYSWGSSKDNVLGVPGEAYKDQMLPLRAGIHSTSFKSSTFYQVAAGMCQSMALTNKGQLYTWGQNKNGLLGTKTSDICTHIPQKVNQYQDLELQQILKCKFYNSLINDQIEETKPTITSNEIFNIQQATAPNKHNTHSCCYKYITCGAKNSFFIDQSGHLLGCGSNEVGLLCKDPKQKQKFNQFVPKDATDIYYSQAFTPIEIVYFKNTQIKHISCAYNHAIAISAKGSAYCWGDNLSNQLGLGFASDYVYTPMRLQGAVEQKKLVMSVCGERFSAILTDSGEIWSFGTSDSGVLGHETKTYYVVQEPRMINDLDPVVYLACSNQTMMAITNEQQLYVWGNNQYGQLGISLQRDDDDQQVENQVLLNLKAELKTIKNPDNYIVYTPQKVQVRSLIGETRTTQIACGLYHSLLVSSTGDLLSCGLVNFAGHTQINNEEMDAPKYKFIDQFAQILTLAGKKFTHIASHEMHSLVLTTTGEIIGWGTVNCGKLGVRVPHDSDMFAAKAVIELKNAQFLACGQQHSMAIQTSGVVNTWGSPLNGRLGLKQESIATNTAMVNSSFPPKSIECFTCQNKQTEQPAESKVDKSKSRGKKDRKKKHSKSKSKGEQNLDISLDDEEVLDEMSFHSDDEEGQVMQDPLQKQVMLQTQECSADNLYLFDAQMDRRVQLIFKDAAIQAYTLLCQYNEKNNKLNQIIDYRSKQLAIKNASKVKSSVKFSVPQFIVKNIQLYELVFSSMYYHPCYMIKLIKCNQLNKFTLMRLLQVIYRNDLLINNNQAIIMTLIIQSFEIEFNKATSQLEFLNELKVMKNNSIFMQIYLMFIQKDEGSNSYFQKTALLLLNEYLLPKIHEQLSSKYDEKEVKLKLTKYFNFHQDKSEDDEMKQKYNNLAELIMYYIESIIQQKDKSRLTGEQLISQEVMFLHNQLLAIIKKKVLNDELNRLNELLGNSDPRQINEKLEKFSIKLEERTTAFLLQLYYGSITSYLLDIQESPQFLDREYKSFAEYDQNIRTVAQSIDRFFQKDPIMPNHHNKEFNELVTNKVLGKKNLYHFHEVITCLKGPVSFSLENLNMKELIKDCYNLESRYLQVEVADIILVHQFYCSQINTNGPEAVKSLFTRGVKDPLFMVFQHLEFREIQTNLFSTEILKRRINLTLMPNPLVQLVQIQGKDADLSIFKCELCSILLTEPYLSQKMQENIHRLRNKGWKCKLGHYNQLESLDCEALGCNLFISQEALKSTRILKYYYKEKDDNIDLLVELLSSIDIIACNINMHQHLNTLVNTNKVRKNVELSNTIEKLLNRLTPISSASDKDKELTPQQIDDQFNARYQITYQKAQIEAEQRESHRALQMTYSKLHRQLESISMDMVTEINRWFNKLNLEELNLKQNMRIYDSNQQPGSINRPDASAYGFYTSASLLQSEVLVSLRFQKKRILKLEKSMKFYFIGQPDGGWVINIVYLQDDIFNLLVPCIKTIYPIELGMMKVTIPIAQYLELRRLVKYKTQATFKSDQVEITFNIQKLVETLKELNQRIVK